MKLLLLNQFFHPDLAATAQLATDLAEDLAAAGVSVTALAGRGSYLGGGTLPARERHRGVEIRRVAATSLGKRTLAHRALDYGSFYAAAAVELLRLPRQDVVLAMTTPPLIAAAALAVRPLRGAKLVYWVQDLYPEIAVAMGVLGPRAPATAAMRAASRQVLSRADAVVVLGEAMRDRVLAAGARADRVEVIPNWADGRAVRPVPHGENPLRAELLGDARHLVMYSGNMGRAHDLQTLLDAARLLREHRDVRFVFLGDGERRREVELAARELPNVRLGPYQPRDRLALSLSAADLHLASLQPAFLGLVEPSKLYGILAAGRPTLFAGPEECEVARTLSREACGVVVPNGAAERLADAVLQLTRTDDARIRMGELARAALEKHHDRRVACRSFERLLDRL
ncbi:glycosyltransferase family 4 protein [Anaeromyxobacter paludicola]|uniref:Glycosyltransferase WbuB n=1 Tax=Anaeromyxobacter paludicola TaxID=2918171 RepID=A0ABN6N8S8_9BACT|nr:glycosyltransferase family 4 protein [Anaeromyxobacter paludicola]BDG09635.1 glycosyltransferase WbuB [Anaeromyxobacter paludicola]